MWSVPFGFMNNYVFFGVLGTNLNGGLSAINPQIKVRRGERSRIMKFDYDYLRLL
jgi:hypothetical protein